MTQGESEPRRRAAGPDEPGPSYGNMGDRHWSRARADANREAIDYYRERSRAPGVAGGGGPRNHYCMACDGVIPFEHAEPTCPHCGAALEGAVRRYFNWVEIDEAPRGDFAALLPWLLGGLALFALGGWALARWVLP